jgi:hypothetical protein
MLIELTPKQDFDYVNKSVGTLHVTLLENRRQFSQHVWILHRQMMEKNIKYKKPRTSERSSAGRPMPTVAMPIVTTLTKYSESSE